MEKTLKILNELEKLGLIQRYAIGGAIAALFHAEPVLTYDMDVYCFLPTPTGPQVTPSPIYEHLREKGYLEYEEHIFIEGVPVHIIPAYNALITEALKQAQETRFKRTRMRVVRIEHLVAILLQTDRPKDRQRLPQLLDEAKIDRRSLGRIIKRHGLSRKWQAFNRRNNDH